MLPEVSLAALRDLLVSCGRRQRSGIAEGNGNRVAVRRLGPTWESVTKTVSRPGNRTGSDGKVLVFSVADVAKWQTQGT